MVSCPAKRIGPTGRMPATATATATATGTKWLLPAARPPAEVRVHVPPVPPVSRGRADDPPCAPPPGHPP
ncbi:hypothetical protein ACPF8X_25765, partial [Streptomyces sp. G35A]